MTAFFRTLANALRDLVVMAAMFLVMPVVIPVFIIKEYIGGTITKRDDLFRHVKTGGQYIVLQYDAVLEGDLTPVVVYQSKKDSRVWVRPKSEFFDGRFEKIT